MINWRTLSYACPLLMEELAEADGIIPGSPTRYGNMAAELKLFIDKTGPIGVRGSLVGKVASVFCTNSTLHSGNESTLLTMNGAPITSRHAHRGRAPDRA